MAVRFEVLDDDGEPRTGSSLVLDGQRILIGRGASSDVRLPEVSVSMRHASIEVTGNRVVVRDERSTNGTFVGAVAVRPVAPHSLEKTSVLRVGRVRMRVTVGTFAPEPEPAIAARQLASRLVAESLELAGVDATPTLTCTGGDDKGASLRLEEDGRAYRLGRDADADLVLTDTDVSRDQTQVTRRGGVVLLRDLNSKNGTLLGEVELSSKRDVIWKLGTLLTLGHNIFELDDPLGKTLASIEAEPDAILSPEPESVGPPSGDAAPPVGAEGKNTTEASRDARARKTARNGDGTDATTRAELAILVTSLVVLALSAMGLMLVLRR